jgi:hypothetical protein
VAATKMSAVSTGAALKALNKLHLHFGSQNNTFSLYRSASRQPMRRGVRTNVQSPREVGARASFGDNNTMENKYNTHTNKMSLQILIKDYLLFQ